MFLCSAKIETFIFLPMLVIDLDMTPNHISHT